MSPAWNSLRAVCGAGLFAALTLLGAAPAAADLVDKAPPDAIYLLSGQEALARGVATRLR